MQWQRQGKDDQVEIIVVYHPIYGEHKQLHHKGNLRIIKNPSNDKTEEFHLDLEDLQLNDTGLYICDIHTFPKGTVQQRVKLEVKGKEDINIPSLPPTTEMPGNISSTVLQRTTLYPTTTSNSSTAWHVSAALSTTLNTDPPTAPSEASSGSEELKTSSPTIPVSSITREPQNSTWSPVSHDSNATATRHDHTPGRTPYDQQNVSLVYQNSTTTEPQTAVGTFESDVRDSTVAQDVSTWQTSTEKSTQEEGPMTQKTRETVVTVVTSSDHSGRTTGPPTEETTSNRSYVALLILPILIVILLTALLYRRYLIRKRMDLPPPFKPPPPPVKYTSVRQQEILMTDILV
ncbi:hypothetical protein ACEWY4_009103 [Coilia grayii]|uniref:Immunoglobulin V-set domain-containing protein n=1 Tax=Coilia grayii TaxID=363190 RepID=A0ABD1K5K8_9TELE